MRNGQSFNWRHASYSLYTLIIQLYSVLNRKVINSPRNAEALPRPCFFKSIIPFIFPLGFRRKTAGSSWSLFTISSWNAEPRPQWQTLRVRILPINQEKWSRGDSQQNLLFYPCRLLNFFHRAHKLHKELDRSGSRRSRGGFRRD